MKNLLLMIAVAVFAIAGAAQKEQPKKTDAKKTTAVKKTPTPAKKAADKKTTEKQTAANTKKPAAKPTTTPKKTIAESSKTTAAKTPPKATPKPTSVKKDPKADLDKALAIEKPEEKITALAKFLSDNPKSDLRPRAAESLCAARVAVGETRFEAGERDNALKLFRLALKEAPTPYPEKLFNEVLSKIPASLYFRGEQAAAIEAAAAIEKNSASSFSQLITLANFYLSTENAADAKRLAEAALKLDDKSATAHQLIGTANRMNFDLETSAGDFAKALELDPESVSARRGLADMNRALGKPEEAIRLYDELIAKDAEDLPAQTGRILSLFDSGKRSDAETEFSRSIETYPANVVLLAGVAYWYAANGENAKAIDVAGKAIAAEPRFIWSHIALARALTADGRFSDAERALLKARQYGNFPTLEYEIASARFAAGFYREAVEELQKSFSVKDGVISVKLGRRIERSEPSFTELLSFERRASLLEPKSAERSADADALKALLELKLLLAQPAPDSAKAAELAEAFIKGSDKMRYHRELFAAGELLEKKIAPEKAFEIARAAITSVDDGLSVPAPAAPLMANELYASRVAAINADKYVLVPEVSKQMLSAIARGRIEEMAGWSLIQQGNNTEAAVRLRRAVSILPEKSAWWRSSLWRLGTALEADGKDKEALDAYVKNYKASDADAGKYSSIEVVYKRVNGSLDGLDALIGEVPAKAVETKAPASVELKTEAKKELAPATLETKLSIDEKTTEKQPQLETKLSETKIPQKEEKIESAPASVEKNLSTDEKTIEKQQPSDTKATETKSEEKKESAPATVEKNLQTDRKPIEKQPPSDTKPAETKSEEKKEETKPSTAEKTTEKQQPSETKLPETKAPEAKVPDTEEKKESTPATVETKPLTDEKTAEKPQSSETKPPESKTSDNEKPVEKSEPTKARPIRTNSPKSKEVPKPLFEPVIIEIKKSEPARPKKDPQAENARPRVVEGKDVTTEGVQTACTISVSQENVALIGGGGSIGLLLKIENGGDLKEVTASSSSPKDVEVALDTEIAAGQTRALYFIRSLTPTTGVYQITFAAPCGKKEVVVRIR